MVGRALILLVDDDSAYRQILLSALPGKLQFGNKAIRLSFMEAESGEGALEIINRQVPDVVLTDMNMPGMNGLGLIRAIKQLPSSCSINLILMSIAYGENDLVHLEQMVSLGKQLGFVFVPKELGAIKEMFRAALENKDAH
jgi:CheY-like chemotaxis protein